MSEGFPHDDKACECGHHDVEVECRCRCDRCGYNRVVRAGIIRRDNIRKRLEKSGISIADMTDLIWQDLEPQIEAKIEKVVREKVRLILRETKLVSTLEW